MKEETETRVIVFRSVGTFSTARPREMKITLPRMPWEPKEEAKEIAA
jgi:hypothetical protein